VPPLDLAGQAGAGCGKAGMGFQTDGFCDDFHGFPGDAEDVSALPIPIVLPREVILGKERRGQLWFSRPGIGIWETRLHGLIYQNLLQMRVGGRTITLVAKRHPQHPGGFTLAHNGPTGT
jgi:hypothetical protein